jgi:hypothetical protein
MMLSPSVAMATEAAAVALPAPAPNSDSNSDSIGCNIMQVELTGPSRSNRT